MSCLALSLTLGILCSSVFPDVSTVILPHSGNINTIKRRIFLESNENVPRNLEMEDSTTKGSRENSPTILRLHPLLAKPAHVHANLPLRFGRDSGHMQRMPKSSINLPQRFGRSGNTKPTSGVQCTICWVESLPSGTLPQRFGKRNLLLEGPFHRRPVFARTIEMPSLKDREQDYDYMIEMVENKDKTEEYDIH